MLAGFGAVNYALLVIAADDGIMPQTKEHLSIIKLLGIENGIIEEFKGCLNNLENPSNKEDLLKSLSNKMPSCKDIEFKLFGLSLATINFLLSFVIVLYRFVMVLFCFVIVA